MTHSATPQIFTEWLAALEARHLADLRVPEVTRALRALSSAYVERRHKVAAGATLDSAGKRAAFALFYAPLHFIIVSHVVRAIGAVAPAPRSIVAAYAMNELPPATRTDVETRLLGAAANGSRVLVVEPIARSLTPWWDAAAARMIAGGGRADEWRFS